MKNADLFRKIRKKNTTVFDLIEDEANVDKRRAAVGLMPLSEYREFLKQMYFPQEKGKQ